MFTLEQSRSLMDNTIVIDSESVKPIVNKHFHKISSAQQSLIAEGICDSGVATTLIDMIQEIIQKLSASAISIVLPMFQERLRRNDSPADISAALENLNAQLGDSLPDAFAEALDVPQDKCESADKLTELVESEVSLKVKSAVSLVINSPTLPEEPAIFVSSSVSSTTSLCHMVTCLKTCVKKVTFTGLGCCSRPSSSESTAPLLGQEELTISAPSVRCESSQSMKSKVSEPSVSQAVATILVKWSSETPETKEDADSASRLTSPYVSEYDMVGIIWNRTQKRLEQTMAIEKAARLQAAASDIVSIISRDLHYFGDDEYSSSNGSHFNTGLILDNVKDFVASQAAPSEDIGNDKQKERKCRFFKFVKRLFEKMKSELKTSIQKEEPDFIVPLSRDSRSSQPAIKKEDAEDFDLPGAVPESPRPNSAACSQTRTPVSMSLKYKMPSSLDFETIKDIVESLFKMLSLPKESAAGANKTDDRVINLTRQFSKDLTDKLYDHFNATSTYQFPSAPKGRRLSDSIISNVRRKVDATQCSFSPEVMYAITEDAVQKFLQQLLIWVEEESNQTSHSEKVSGALGDIEDLITKLVTQPEESPEVTDRQPTAPCSTPVEPFNDAETSPSICCDDDSGDIKQFNSLILGKNNVIATLGVKRAEATSESTPLSSVCSSKKSDWELSEESTDASSLISEKTTNDIITALLLRLTINVPQKSGQSSQTEDMDTIVQRLSEMARDNIRIDYSAIKNTRKNMKMINKAVITDLKRDFGSTEHLLEVAMASNSSSFDEAVLKSLIIHLDALHRSERSAVASFFSSVGNAIAKPFWWCTIDSTRTTDSISSSNCNAGCLMCGH